MKKLIFLSVFMGLFIYSADSAEPVQRRAIPVGGDVAANVIAVNSGRAAVRGASPTTSAAPAISARSAVRGGAPRAITAQSLQNVPAVSARAAATQKVVGTGTKVAAANENIVVNSLCRQKFDGCMDSFCMIDNDNGGRCACSNRKSELDTALSEIEKLDAQSYKMATEGVESLEMGADADAASVIATAAAKKISDADAAANKRKLTLNLWDTAEFQEEENIFNIDQNQSVIDGKAGDKLYKASAELCRAQIPECAGDISMLQMMYTQAVKSDCTAYENDLKVRKNASAQKLSAAQRSMHDAALESLRVANKYDLGQCTIEFKKCMIATAGCKDDFTGCVGIAAAENAKMSGGSKSSMKQFDIKGSVTKISVAASTMDALFSKKPMCESVTNSCVAVKGQVWDTFLREVAPQLKTAELLAESDLRTNCISNISSCFQKACKDTIDPNNPDGSFDMCLTRPETVRSLCKVQIDPCVAAEPMIMDFVYARLAGMRVDSCTAGVKECLQSDDRCGSDYTKCVGLDTDTIIRMCPYDKLVGCQKAYKDSSKDIKGDAVYTELSTMVQGIMLNIDNNMLGQCQNAANAAMVKVCGGTDDCNGLAVDEGIGSRSLEYKICGYTNSADDMSIDYAACRTNISQIQDSELRDNAKFAGVLDGTIYWESIDFDESGNLKDVNDYVSKIAVPLSDAQKAKVMSELSVLQKSINTAIQTIEADPTVQYCITGRAVQGMKVDGKEIKLGDKTNARFPELTRQMKLTIASYAIKAAKENYYTKYDELSKNMLKDYTTIGERLAAIAKEDAKDVRREFARRACMGLAAGSSLPKSPNPPANSFGKILSPFSMATAVVAIPFTGFGLFGNVLGGSANGNSSSIKDNSWNVCKVGESGATATAANAGAGGGLMSSKDLNQWNYKEVVTTTYACETMVCHKCVRSQNCGNTKNPIFGKKYCKDWDAEVEKCDDTQF